MNRRALITGCNGFIGRHVLDSYISMGYEVYGLDIKCNNTSNIKCKFIECNLQEDNIGEIYKDINPDIFIHCAGNANVGKSVEYPEMDFNSNVNVLYRTLSALVRENINPRFVFLSSAAVYGNPQTLPIKEDTPLNPISPYGLHKMMCEDLCKYYRDIKGQNISVIRIFSAYGEGLRKQILWDMYNKYKNNGSIELFGTGNETRDFIYIKDLVQALHLVVNQENSDFIYNVANGEEINIRDLAEEYAKELHMDLSKVKFNDIVKKGDPLNWKANICKLQKIGYKKSVSLSTGIKNYINWVKEIDRE